MDKNNKPRRASINFPPEIEKALKERAERNGRSLTKEVVQIVKVQLAQEKADIASTDIS